MMNTKLFTVDGWTISVSEALDLFDREQVQIFEQAVSELAENGADEVVLDFTTTETVSSSIITLVFIAVNVLKNTDTSLTVLASMNRHRNLVAAGLMKHVDLRLCS